MRHLIAAAFIISFGWGGMTASAKEGDTRTTEQATPEAPRSERININTATTEELVALPSIGPSRAKAIIQEREKRRFRRIEDIIRVPGIGRKTFRRLRYSIRVD